MPENQYVQLFKMDISKLFEESPEVRKFVKEYVDMIANLNECNMILKGDFSLKSKEDCKVRICNIDLWIDSKINDHPFLELFRVYVLADIKAAGLKPHPDFIYKSFNHYKR